MKKDRLINKIEKELPDLITQDLFERLNLEEWYNLFHINLRRRIPFITISEGRKVYLKIDIIRWIKRYYKDYFNYYRRSPLERRVNNLFKFKYLISREMSFKPVISEES
jgi:hypothetical protein